jgi:hypothetical protein
MQYKYKHIHGNDKYQVDVVVTSEEAQSGMEIE